ncbi:DUF433 domain-containing protein [Cellulomonas sp.]|uniref:DUF433 domain-containing protein n=1 Tax=Cellulomonas sp. TaxID=40001 RepID=UPI002D54ADBB|nr:DUF433 domain-containing protein [Cellulomonas sp.]HYQ76184.1 DUF433 domain-containing protein [Cellulomonas sp.]
MAFPLPLAAALTGATPAQLRHWRDSGLVVPEVRPFRPPLYSFRDLVLIRSVAYLRAHLSSQKVHKAMLGIPDVMDAVVHPSEYRFGTDGETVYLGTESGEAIDILRRRGQTSLFTFDDMLSEFRNFKDERVADFARPSAHLEVAPGRVGGWPTIEGTRVPYDDVARLVDNETVFPEDVQAFYPSVSPAAARDAVEFAERVEALGA